MAIFAQRLEKVNLAGSAALKGKRDSVIIALLVGCALRRRELATLNIEDIQLREGRWVIIDLRGKGGRIRTVAVPIWVKQGNQRLDDRGQDRGRPPATAALQVES